MILVNGREQGLIAASAKYMIGVKSDGTAAGQGYNSSGQLNTESFSELVSIAATGNTSFGLRADGSVVGAGSDSYSMLTEATSWGGVVQLSGSIRDNEIAGLLTNGTVVMAGWNYYGQEDALAWVGITQIGMGTRSIVGIKADGTVVAAGSTAYNQLEVGTWTDIIQVASGSDFNVGLKADGTVIATGTNGYGQCNVGAWTDIIQIAAGESHTLGLKADGTVVATGRNNLNQLAVSGWHSVIEVACGQYFSIGLKADGTLVGAGENNYGQSDEGTISGLSMGQYYPITGITSLDGTPTPMTVRAYEETTGRFQLETQSDANGQYTLHLPRWYNGYIMSIPPAGHRPMAHGPITPPPEDTQV